MKSFGHLSFYKLLFRNISGVIFTNMKYRYMTNLENFERKSGGRHDVPERLTR